MLVAQNSLGPVCPVPLTVRGTALAAAASAAHPAAAHPAAAGAAPANCSRHIRVGVFDDANPIAAAFQTGWMDNAATACYSFHHMSTGNRAIERLANGDLWSIADA